MSAEGTAVAAGRHAPDLARPARRALAFARSPEGLVGLALAIWSLVPLFVLLGGHGVFNGAYGLQVDDQMQYLSFVRESGQHALIANRFDVIPDPHLFLHPVFLVSGLLWRLGASLQLGYLFWQPIAIAVMFAGWLAYARRTLGPDPRRVAVGLALALFFFTPATPLAHWLGAGQNLQFGTLVMGLETFPGAYGWSGAPATIAIGLLPLALLAAERALDPARRAPGRSARWYALWGGAAGLFVSWLHPWQGLELLVMLGALVAWGRFRRRYVALAAPIALTALPIAYFFALSRTHSAWGEFSHSNDFAHVGTWLVLGLAPALLALPGLPGRDLDVQERLLRLWPAAVLLVYFALHSTWFYQALGALSLPVAILAVRGWRRLRAPRTLGLALCAAVTVPGMVFVVQRFSAGRQDHFYAPGEMRALAWLDASPRPGAVLAPQRFGRAVPGFAGRDTWVGNYQWTPDYPQRLALSQAMFGGRMNAAGVRAMAVNSRVAFVVSDCHSRGDLGPALAPLTAAVRRFGCATVYELRPGA